MPASKIKVGMDWEKRLIAEGHRLVAGVDEAGRGALAGPVVAACVIISDGMDIDGIDDSKRLTPARRSELNARIISNAAAVGVGIVEPVDIDRINILAATLEAMRIAFSRCMPKPDAVLVDGNQAFIAPVPIITVIGGDKLSVSIAAASIVAKVTRDAIMDCAARRFEGYGFERHKGYGTAEHLRVIYSRGPSEIHRMSFSPLCEMDQVTLFNREEVGLF